MKPRLHHHVCARPVAICWVVGTGILWIPTTMALWSEGIFPAAIFEISTLLLLLLGYASLAGIGFFVGHLPFFWLVVRVCRHVNGGPYAVGDRVTILTGANAGTTTTVYNLTRGQADDLLPRVELGTEARGKYLDIRDDFTLLRTPEDSAAFHDVSIGTTPPSKCANPALPRRATFADLASIARLHRLAFFHAMPHMPVLHTPDEDLVFYSTVVFPSTEIWLGEDADLVAGFIAFRPGWVDHLYVHPERQGSGIGSALLELAKVSNPSLCLWTFKCNLRARRFYERHGFKIEQETDGADNEERQPDVLYSWTSRAPTHAEHPP